MTLAECWFRLGLCVVVVGFPPRVLVGWSEVRWSFAGRLEEHPVDGCRCSFYCCMSCGCRYTDHYVNSSDHTCHPDHRHIDHKRRSGRRDSDHGGRLDGNRLLGVIYPVIVGDRYRGPGRNYARPEREYVFLGSIWRTGAVVVRLSMLYSHCSMVCDRDWKMGHCGR